MQTTHEVHVGDARSMAALDDGSVELVVTSPPYPMVEMWDDLFADLDPRVGELLAAGDGQRAFEVMHGLLDPVWTELERVLAPGGIACINVGDANRRLDDEFRLYPNHAVLQRRLAERGLNPLPDLLWRKPSNKPSKFMGSGMLPPNAYVAHEHEYVLVFRKGGLRSLEPGVDRRYEAAYFWEERNDWFSDLWEGVQGVDQTLADDDLRERSGAFPFEVPYRLICMFSVYGDVVLDPFWGTGTTSLAAAVAGRSSVGYELDREFSGVFGDRVDRAPDLSREVIERRLAAHRAFVDDHDGDLAYDAEYYDFPVKTKQEREIRFYAVEGVREDSEGRYVASHVPY